MITSPDADTPPPSPQIGVPQKSAARFLPKIPVRSAGIAALAVAAGLIAWKCLGLKLPSFGGLKNASNSPAQIDQRMAMEKFGGYADARASVEVKRRHLAAKWRSATAPAARNSILAESEIAFTESIMRNIVPFWYGTPWDFNGTTETPGRGKIACGYFVATALNHSGLQLNRIRTAQQASQCIIRTLTTDRHMKTGHGLPLEEFVAKMRAWGPGLSIVGLNFHVGLLWHDGSELWFVHSSGAKPREVVKERAAESGALRQSRYRIAGKISSDPAVLTGWLEGRWFETVLETPKVTARP